MTQHATIRFGTRDYKHTSLLRIACNEQMCTATMGVYPTQLIYLAERSKNRDLYDRLKPFASEEPPFPMRNLTQAAFASDMPPQNMFCKHNHCNVEFRKTMWSPSRHEVRYSAEWLKR